MRYAALLRGVNVGTAKRVPMAGLRALVEGLGGDVTSRNWDTMLKLQALA